MPPINKRVLKLLALALERVPGERAEFLDAVCGEDHELKKELNRLLALADKTVELGLSAPPVVADAGQHGDPEGQTVATDLDLPDALLQNPRYTALERIGEGAMGVVFRARHNALDKLVAVKLLRPGTSTSRFLREARLLAKIESPYVVAVRDFETFRDGSRLLCMDWIDGTDLYELLGDEKQGLPEDRALQWMHHVSQGMQEVAAQGIIHRDLKPSNILIDNRGRARVADFGLARDSVTSAGLSRSGQIMGTAYYMSPEQAEDPRRVDTRADIYSFGATFYHVLTGVPPFTADSFFSVLFKHKVEPLIPPRSRNQEISSNTSELLERCLAKSPADRFQSFGHLREHIPDGHDHASPWDAVDDTAPVPRWEQYIARRETYLRCVARREILVKPDLYEFPSHRSIEVVAANMADEETDAIVSSDDNYLSMGGGVSAAIRRAAGDVLEAEARRYVPVRPGRAVVTSGGRLRARFVFHGVTIDFRGDKIVLPSRDVISEILASCFYHADTLGVRSLSLPLLGTGAGGFPPAVCLDVTFRFLARTLNRGTTCVERVRVVLAPPPAADVAPSTIFRIPDDSE